VLSDALAGKHHQLAQAIKPGAAAKIGISVDGQLRECVIEGTRSLQRLVGFFDGTTALRDAVDICRKEFPTVTEATLFGEIRRVFDLFHPVGCAYLRKSRTP